MGGKYQGSTATSSATGAANTNTLLWSDNVAAGAISDENALGVHLEVLGYSGSGEVWATLNGREIFREVGIGGGSRLRVELNVWRKDNTTADATGTEYVDNVTGQVPDKAVTGLSWGSQQTLAVYGKSSVQGGLVLQRAGILK